MPTTSTSLHPLRWTALVLVVVPAALLLALLFLSVTGHRESAASIRNLLRGLLLFELSLLILFAIWGLIYERMSLARDLRLYPPVGRLIDVGGYRLHLYCTGDGGPTVVLEHGLDGSYLDWRLVQPQIAQFTRVCSYDRAGYGWSDVSPKARIPSVMADELHTLLQNAGEKPPFILVAHSMGSFPAFMYAHHYPDEVSGLILVDGSHPEREQRFPFRENLSLRFLQLTSPFGLPRWRKWCCWGPEELRPVKAAVNCKAKVFSTHYEQWKAYPEAAAEVRNLPNSLVLPLVVISRDPARNAQSPGENNWNQLQKKLLAFSPTSKQVIAEGSGHGIPGQRPDIVVQAVRQMIEQINAAGPRSHP